MTLKYEPDPRPQPRGLDLVKTIRDMKRLLQRLIGEQAELVFELLGPARLYADPETREWVSSSGVRTPMAGSPPLPCKNSTSG